MIKIILDTIKVEVTINRTVSIYMKETLGVRIFDNYNIRTVQLYDRYRNIHVCNVCCDDLDPSSTYYTNDMDIYGEDLANHIMGGEFYTLLIYQSNGFSVDKMYWIDDSGSGNHAHLTESFCHYFNGTNSYGSITHNLVAYIDYQEIEYSLDGTSWDVWHTGDSTVSGLFRVDKENLTLTIGYDGVNYFRGWIGRNFYNKNNVKIFDFTFAENLNTSSYNRIFVDDYLPYQFPLGLNQYLKLNSNLLLNI